MSREWIKMLHGQLAMLIASGIKGSVIYMHPLDIAVLIREYMGEEADIKEIYELTLIGCKVIPDCALKRGEPLAMSKEDR